MTTLKQTMKLAKEIRACAVEAGARVGDYEGTHDLNDLFFQTVYGELRVFIDPDDYRMRGKPEPEVSIMCRFTDDNRDRWISVAHNKHSGKWN